MPGIPRSEVCRGCEIRHAVTERYVKDARVPGCEKEGSESQIQYSKFKNRGPCPEPPERRVPLLQYRHKK